MIFICISLSSGLPASAVFYFCREKMPQLFNFPNTTTLNKKGQWNRSLGMFLSYGKNLFEGTDLKKLI